MTRLEAAAMLRHDAAQLDRVLRGQTAELRLRQIGPELIWHLLGAAAALEQQ